MGNEFSLALKDVSVETIVISLLVFGLTMLIKYPIKNYTAKFEENKRKAINTVIIFIPLALAYLLSSLYFGLFKNCWFGSMIISCSATSYILAITVYTIYSRIVNMIKSGKIQSTELSVEAISYIKANIKTISKTLKLDEKKLQDVVCEIQNLINFKSTLTTDSSIQDIKSAENFDKQLQQLKQQEAELSNSVSENKKLLEAYQNSLKTKGE